jgi:RNA-directed DNA polymerase
MRPLGIPTISDRIAQEVVRARLEEVLEPIFHEDSYGYRPNKSAIDAVGKCRERNWKYAWALEVDIQKFFDTVDHELLMKAVRKHCPERWMELYIERWLKADIQHPDGRIEKSERGTPQGGVVSPLLANLYLHYAFDEWMKRTYPSIKFERYADDLVCHCRSKQESQELMEALRQRLTECRLTLHPDKTRVVYCKSSKRKEDYPVVSYTFLGYTFQPRHTLNKQDGSRFVSFLPAASRDAQKSFRRKLREHDVMRYTPKTIEEVAQFLNPLLRGWFNYFSRFYPSSLYSICFYIEWRLIKWAKSKYRWGTFRAVSWLKRLMKRKPPLFAHWGILALNG